MQQHTERVLSSVHGGRGCPIGSFSGHAGTYAPLASLHSPSLAAKVFLNVLEFSVHLSYSANLCTLHYYLEGEKISITDLPSLPMDLSLNL